MTNRSSKSWPCSRARGLTLIEVVAAVAILGTILVSVVLAKARHTRQLARAQHTSAAVAAADELITRWWSDGRRVPIDESGAVADRAGLTWRTRTLDETGASRLGGRVVRVELFAPAEAHGVDPDEPLLFVDLVLPEIGRAHV